MDESRRTQVRLRASDCCEYCQLPQERELLFIFHIEHIIARQHGGSSELGNLALACFHCNMHKGTNLTSIDPQSGDLTPLYHPRRQSWDDHFVRSGATIHGTSSVGRATAFLLKMNAPDRQRLWEA